LVTYTLSGNAVPAVPAALDWRSIPPASAYYAAIRRRPSVKTFLLAVALFFLTLCTCLAAGTQFAAAYAHNQAVSIDEFVRSFTLFYRHPAALLSGLPFALTLMAILLAHELGHFFACRHHHIRASYPFFIPAPTLIGTFGAFILIRSPIRTTRALFDVGASGPLVGFVLAVPALVYGILHAKIVPGLADPAHSEVLFGIPLILRFFAAVLHPDVNTSSLLLHPVGRAAWVGLFATSLNLLPAGQLDGGHILRSLSTRAHRSVSLLLPLILVTLGFFQHWPGWYIWAGILLGLRFLRAAPIYDSTPLDPHRRFGALLALGVFILCFMPAPI
jgi:membrane-associated protease RseP (regulator of RpoE activity)